MKATVTYQETGSPTRFEVTERDGYTVTFRMDGSTAVASSVTLSDGMNQVYIDDMHRHLDFAKTLPFVQAVVLDDYDDEKEP